MLEECKRLRAVLFLPFAVYQAQNVFFFFLVWTQYPKKKKPFSV